MAASSDHSCMDIWPGIRRVVACIASSFTQGQRGHSLRKVSDNFRCISLLSIPGKVYPVVIMARISSHICAQLLVIGRLHLGKGEDSHTLLSPFTYMKDNV